MIRAVRFLILAFWYVVLCVTFLEPRPVRAARVYNGTSDDGTATSPTLPAGVKKIAMAIQIKVSSWPSQNGHGVFSEDSASNTIDGTVDILGNYAFFNTTCSTTNQFYFDWGGTKSNAGNPGDWARWATPPSTGAIHVIYAVWSLPGVSGTPAMAAWLDGSAYALSGGLICPNANFTPDAIAPAGTTIHVLGDGTVFHNGTLYQAAMWASADTAQGSVAGFNGAGLPTQACGNTTPCTEKTSEDVAAMNEFPWNSNCISAQPVIYWPQLASDAASGTDPDWGINRGFSGAAHPMTLVGTTALILPSASPCPNGLSGVH